MSQRIGVTLSFFCAAIDALDKLYPDRSVAPEIDVIRERLQEVEDLYEGMPLVKQPAKKRKPKT